MMRRPISDCHLPWEWLLVDPLGAVQPCCWATKSVGNLKEQTVGEVWNGPDMIRLRRSIVDGYIDRVCRHAGCKFVRDTEKAFGADAYDFRCPLNEEVSLRDNGRPDHCLAGWSVPESWGIWSEGETATVILDLAEKPTANFRLEILCRGAGCEHIPMSFVGVRINGRQLDRWEFNFPDTFKESHWRVIQVPAELVASSRVELQFLIESPMSPRLWGREDSRLIGIGLSALRVVTQPYAMFTSAH
jgi:hypothetical protein